MATLRDDISCVDLFCGAGGLTYGFICEGLPVKAGIDLDPVCSYPYTANNEATFVQQDISKTSPAEVEELFTPNTIKVLAGCAPCQPFSTYSFRYKSSSVNDDKWGLLYEFARLVEGVRPDIVTMENVPAIRRHGVFVDFVKALKSFGYNVWHDVVDCSRYGVPQSRKRVVLLASLHGTIKLIPSLGEQHRKTVRQTISSLSPISAGDRDPDDRLHVSASLSDKNLRRIQASTPGGSWRDWPDDLIAECHRLDSGRTYPSVYGRMEWDKPAPTMTTQCYGYGNGRFGHPAEDRGISLREAAMLQGFPKKYQFVEPHKPVHFSSMGRLIGNAVPVYLARVIAKSIIKHIDKYDVKPQVS